MPRRRTFRRRVLTKRSQHITGLTDAISKLNDLGEAVESDDVYEVLMEGAEVLRDAARAKAPYDEAWKQPFRWFRGRKHQKEVHLRDAIFASEGDPSRDKRGPTVIAGVNKKKAPHAAFLERGTSRMSARPFWRPAISENRLRIAQMYADGIRKIIDRVSRH